MRRKQTLQTEVEKTIKLLITTLAIIIIVLLIVFLFSTGKKAQQGYLLEQARNHNEELKNKSEGLKAKLTNAQSTSNFDESEIIDEMTPPEDEILDYLLPEDNN
ncbi:hypothetical protein HOG17_01790 [Candidatus Peregrinibacteria bacterium]|jgi:hypothetical protein|nr:hypothetical protein [Candidatus Peregrinibacteria bacterium]MBT4148090.1 hypothetical protein [Candidatus Peregrinibacteria bacterium]MBT4365854.1 hypothetical protein [Candidatus Peregrinibacteria bacterium]MBT4456456.1 hypothetical protein [Candidatus Peregrinibacteria bacterium]